MKSGITVTDCPHCGGEQPHAVALIGRDVYLCCKQCRAVTLGDAESQPVALPERRLDGGGSPLLN